MATRLPGDRWTLSAAKGTPGGSSRWQTTRRRNAHPLFLAQLRFQRIQRDEMVMKWGGFLTNNERGDQHVYYSWLYPNSIIILWE